MRTVRLIVLAASLAAIGAPSASALAFLDENFPLPEGIVGQPYSYTLKARAGCPPYTFKVIAGSLPAGITLASEGLLSGTPTAAGKASFWVQLGDLGCGSFPSERLFDMTIKPRVKVTTESLSAATAGVPYSVTLTAEGPTPLTWTVFQGALPSGMSLTAQGVVVGTPTAVAPASFVVKATHQDGRSDTKSLTLEVLAPLVANPVDAAPAAEVGRPFDLVPTASGGKQPYAWSVAGHSALPPGLVIDGATGRVSGVPTVAGPFQTALALHDANGSTMTVTFGISVAPRLAFEPATPPDRRVGRPYRLKLAATGGVGPKTWQILEGELPRGLDLQSRTGVLSGRPVETGRFPIRVEVRDSIDALATGTLVVSVASPKLTIVTKRLADIGIARPYKAKLRSMGGFGRLTWEIGGGKLPRGIRLDPVTGSLSGRAVEAGRFRVTVEVADSLGRSATKRLAVLVRAPRLAITAWRLATGRVDRAYRARLDSKGGLGRLRWTVARGRLPRGLRLDRGTGLIVGRAREAGRFRLTVSVADSLGRAARKGIVLVIQPE
jgi:hypothetical protein